jgi:PAS domain S-box-containing protein
MGNLPVEMWRVLMVDPDEAEYLRTKAMLSQIADRRVDLDWAPDYPSGNERLDSNQYQAVLVEFDLTPHNGVNFIGERAAQGDKAALIFYPGQGDFEHCLDAIQAGATLYLPKPEATPRLLEQSLRIAIQQGDPYANIYGIDITERRLAEDALRERERHYRNLFESMSEGFALGEIIPDETGQPASFRFLEVNPSFEKQTGLKAADILHRPFHEVLPGLKRYTVETLNQVATTGESVRFESFSQDLGRWLDNYAFCPEPGKFALLFMDISDRKRAEQALLESERFANKVVQASLNGLYIFDPVEGQITFINPQYTNLTGYTLADLQALSGLEFLDLFHPEDRSRVNEHIQAIRGASNGEIFEIEYRFKRSDGRWIWSHSYETVFSRHPDGSVCQYIGTFIDVTARKQAEEALQDYSEQLKRSNEALEDFAFIASHDLREPLRKVQAFGDALRARYSQDLDERGRDYVERMYQAVERMNSMLDGLLAYSRVTTRGQAFKQVDLHRLATEVLSDLEISIRQTRGQVELQELPVIDADPVQIRQLFQNLIGNALKYHRPGVPPRVTVSSTRTSPDQIEISVRDNGAGFDMAFAGCLFQPFHRLHNRSVYAGTGMGLAICRKIVERHGGSIAGRSVPGEGSVFAVILPCNQY